MIPETIQEMLESHPFKGIYEKNIYGHQLIIPKEKSAITMPKELRLTLQERRRLDYMVLDMLLAYFEGKVHSDDLRLEIQQRNVVKDFIADSGIDRFLLYVDNGREFGIPYVLVTDVPLQLGITPNQANAQKTDKKERIFIGDFVESTGLERDVVFLGAINHIRIYSPANWEIYKKIARQLRSNLLKQFYPAALNL